MIRESRGIRTTAVAVLVLIAAVLTSCSSSTATIGHWAGPVVAGSGASMIDVSCPTASTCLAVDGRGTSTTLRAGTWSAPVPITGAGSTTADAPVAVSCGSPTTCVAGTGNGSLPIYDGQHWTNGPAPDGGNQMASVSCASAQFCAAVDTSGQALTYSGAWSTPVTVDHGGSFASVSCVSPTFCLAVTSDSPSTAFWFDGQAWKQTSAPNPSTPRGGSEPDVLAAVSCATPAHCVAIDTFGEAFTYNGRGWSAPATFDADMQNGNAAVSCPSRTFCMIVDDVGNATAVVGTSLGPHWHVDSSSIGLDAVSCATAGRCVAVGPAGRVYTFEGRPPT